MSHKQQKSCSNDWDVFKFHFTLPGKADIALLRSRCCTRVEFSYGKKVQLGNAKPCQTPQVSVARLSAENSG